MGPRTSADVGHSWDIFEVALRTGGLGTWETDLGAGTRTWTASAIEIFGIDVPIDESIPFAEHDHLRDVMHPDDRDLLDGAHAVFGDQDEIEVAYRIIHPKHGLRYVAGRGRVVERNAGGTPVRVVHIVSDVTQRHEIETRNLMLMRELTHRTKNQLAIVLAIARRLGRSAQSLEAFQDAFSHRVTGMASSIDALVEPIWGTVPLKTLVLSHLRDFTDPSSERLFLRGKNLELDSGAGEALGMALHELAVNASQHGALSNANGRIEIAWSFDQTSEGGPALKFEWTERHGPTISNCGPPGFGSAVLTTMTETALNADVNYSLGEDGAYWGMTAPIIMPGTGVRSGTGIHLMSHPD